MHLISARYAHPASSLLSYVLSGASTCQPAGEETRLTCACCSGWYTRCACRICGQLCYACHGQYTSDLLCLAHCVGHHHRHAHCTRGDTVSCGLCWCAVLCLPLSGSALWLGIALKGVQRTPSIRHGFLLSRPKAGLYASLVVQCKHFHGCCFQLFN